jgi:hypothetical protein
MTGTVATGTWRIRAVPVYAWRIIAGWGAERYQAGTFTFWEVGSKWQ